MELEKTIVKAVGAVPVCTACGSAAVKFTALVEWNPAAGMYQVAGPVSDPICTVCGAKTVSWQQEQAVATSLVRDLNDRFRTTGEGHGSMLITEGVQTKGLSFVRQALDAVRTFDAFSEDNDPWGEHDFGAVELDGEKLFWKLDYYDLGMTMGSPNPADETVTTRVLTIMLASEY